MSLAERICSVQGCGRGGKLTRGMCAKHYRYWIDHTPKDQRPVAPRFARRFWDYVDKSGDCWLWIGPRNRAGYGWWSGNGERGLAHRISLALVQSPPTMKSLACHHCDNPPCVNPSHLYWGTVRDNSADVVARGGVHNKGVFATHCKNGHEISGENLRIAGKQARRLCKTCDNARARDYQRRRRNAQRDAS
jgi:hypothetical protein